MKLRNDKEINALFASAHSPTEPTEVSGCARYSPTDCTDTHSKFAEEYDAVA